MLSLLTTKSIGEPSGDFRKKVIFLHHLRPPTSTWYQKCYRDHIKSTYKQSFKEMGHTMKKIKNRPSKKNTSRLQALLDQAIQLQIQKNYLSSEAILQQILTIDPNYGPAYHYLALIAKEFGSMDAALALIEKSIELDKKSADAFYNYGVLLALLDRLEDAEKAYEIALTLNKNMYAAWFNLANSYFKHHQYHKVRQALKHFLKTPNHQTSLYPQIAKYYFDIGDLETSAKICEKTLQMNIDPSDTLWTFMNTQQYLQDSDHFLTQVKKARTHQHINSETLTLLIIYQAIAEWQLGLLDACQTSIETVKPSIDKLDHNTINQSLRSYYTFLTQLLLYCKNNPNKKTSNHDIYLLGDSHSLSNSNQVIHLCNQDYKTTSKLLFGCKAFHLAQPNNNKFKAAFNNAIHTIPEHGTIVMMIGEIDCRINEGILPTFKKGGCDLSTLIHDTVSNYVAFVLSRTKPKNIQVYFYGVPACKRLVDIPDDEMDLLKQVIQIFNQELKHTAIQSGNKFIDIYQLTVGENGLSDGRYHIDDFHLLPRCIEAAEISYLEPST